MLPLMQQNVAMNRMSDVVSPRVYDWGEPVPNGIPSDTTCTTTTTTTTPDIVLAADCVYFEPAFPLLHKTLLDLIGDNTVCYFCFKKRRRADMHFIKGIRKAFDVAIVNDDPERMKYSRESIHL